jgi:hypothetical protein
MDEATAALGEAFHDFSANVCPAYNTKELCRETDAHCHRQSKHANASKKNPSDGEPLVKTFNLQTYKYHALDDYAQTIRQLGTTDSYSTSIVSIIKTLEIVQADRNLQGELEHCRPKGWHLHTDRRNFVKQMTQIERCQAHIRHLKHKLLKRPEPEDVATAHDAHHHIGSSQNHPEHIPTFLRNHGGDPAIQVCIISAYLEHS